MHARNTNSQPAADYALAPNELSDALKALTERRQPVMVWGAPGVGKSACAVQVAKATGREYVDIRALLIDPVDLRGIPWRDTETGQTRWAPPEFLPREKSDARFLINLEELPSAPSMVQAALYQLVLDRRVGEYKLPDGAAVIACGNRVTDRGVVHNMPTPLASRFVHLEVKTDAQVWCDWAAQNGVAPEVIFFIQMRPELLHQFDPQSKEKAFPCPRTWEFVSGMLDTGLPAQVQRSLVRGAVGEGAAVEFTAFLTIWRELPHPKVIIESPDTAPVPRNASALIAACGSLCSIATEENFGAILTYAGRLRPEIAEFLITTCVRRSPDLRYTEHFIAWASKNQS